MNWVKALVRRLTDSKDIVNITPHRFTQGKSSGKHK